MSAIETTTTIPHYWVDEEGCDCEGTIELPATREVCGNCQGKGQCDPPAFSNGFTAEDFAEDPDFAEDYFRGVYDVTCPECKGERVTDIPNYDAMNPEQRAAYEEYCQYQSELAAEQKLRERGVQF